MDDAEFAFTFACMGLLVGLMCGAIVGDCTGTRAVQDQAVAMGYAHYSVVQRSVQFEWNPTPTPNPEKTN